MLPHLPGLYKLSNPAYLEANRGGTITEEQAALLGPSGRALSKRFQRAPRLNGIVVILVLAFFLALQVAGIELSTPLVLGAIGLALVVLAAQIGSRWTKKRQLNALIEKDLEHGEVREVTGVPGLGRDPALVHISGQALRLPLGSKEGLAPGLSQRVYYLPASGLILSAEPVEEQPEGRELEGLTAALAEANGFHLESLDANRRGELTRAQLPRLYGSLISPLIFILVPGGFLFYQLNRAGVFQDPTPAVILENLLELSTSLLVMGGVLGALTVWGLALLVRTVMDLVGGQVAAVAETGYRQTSTSSDEDGTTTNRSYRIGGFSFRVSERGFNAFVDGRQYRAYFTPRRKILVNIEVIN